MPTKYQGNSEERKALDLFIKLARGSESFIGRLQAPIVAAGLTPSQFGVLETLYHLGKLMPSTLAEKHLKSRNNLCVVIDHLERDGLVRRERCDKDRRAQWVHLTDAGRQRVEGVLPQFVAGVVREASVLSTEEQDQLCSLLKKLGRGLGV